MKKNAILEDISIITHLTPDKQQTVNLIPKTNTSTPQTKKEVDSSILHQKIQQIQRHLSTGYQSTPKIPNTVRSSQSITTSQAPLHNPRGNYSKEVDNFTLHHRVIEIKKPIGHLPTVHTYT